MCEETFPEEARLAVHFHQCHLNPHHLSPQDILLFRLSNFLVRVHETTEETKTDFPGLYRCHDCYNVFDHPANLARHLSTHRLSSGGQDMVSAPQEKIPSKVDMVSAPQERMPIKEDIVATSPKKTASKGKAVFGPQEEPPFSKDVVAAPQEKTPTKQEMVEGPQDKTHAKVNIVAALKEKMPTKVDQMSREDFEDVAPKPKKSRAKLAKPLKTKQKRNLASRKKGKVSGRSNQLLKLQSVLSDEVVSDDSDAEATLKPGRPQRECKSRTSTLVAISLAEQEYEQFDLDFERFKTDVNSISEVDLARMKHATEMVLADRDNIPDDFSDKDVGSPSDEINLENGSIKSSNNQARSKSTSNEREGKPKKTIRKKIVLTKLTSKNGRKVKKAKNKSSLIKDELKSDGDESSTKENDMYEELSETLVTGQERRGRGRGTGKPEGALSRLKGAVRDRARNVVTEVLQPPPDFLCFHCRTHFSDYKTLRSHKKLCKLNIKPEIYKDSKDPLEVKTESLEQANAELYEYVTGNQYALK